MGSHLVIPQISILYTNEQPPVQPPALKGHFCCVTRVAAHSRFYCSPSVEHFKLNLNIHKQHTQTTPFFPHLYLGFINKAAVNHTRIRFRLSALNFQFSQYNFVDMSCDKCGAMRKNVAHLLFHCPTYAVPNQTL